MDPVSCAEIKPYAPVMMDKSEEISHLLVRSWYPAQSAQNCLVGEQISRGREGKQRAALSGPLVLIEFCCRESILTQSFPVHICRGVICHWRGPRMKDLGKAQSRHNKITGSAVWGSRKGVTTQSPRKRLVRGCEKHLPGSAWLSLSKTCIPFPGPLYSTKTINGKVSVSLKW